MKDLVFLCIEDDVTFSEILQKKIREFILDEEFHITFKVYDHLPENLQYDLFDACFLDVEIGEESTLPIMEAISSLGVDIPVIVISNYDKYIFNSVKFHIFDYVRKACFDDEIKITLEHLKTYLLRLNRYVFVYYNSQRYRIYIQDIVYIRIKSHRIFVYLKDHKVIDIWKDYQNVFIDVYPDLVRVHKSCVVNISYCFYFDKHYLYLNNGERLKISKSGFQNLMKAYHL